MENEKQNQQDTQGKNSKIRRAITVIVVILLLLALIVCLIVIFTHRHDMTHFEADGATCTADGNYEYWYCAGCGKYFEDEDGKTEVEYTEVIIPAAGHSWTAASCQSSRSCSVCGFSDGEALGHDFSEYIFDDNATCTADGTQTATCSRCDESDTKILYGSALGHSWGDYRTITSATCTKEGKISRSCSACGNRDTVSVPATGVHNWNFESGVVTPATGTAEGKIVYSCSDCSETLEVTFPATGEHDWQLDKGEVRSVASCKTDGEIVYPCADCSEVLTVKIPVNSAAHSYGEGVVTEPDCITNGSVVFSCEYCDSTVSAEIPATGVHSWGNEKVTGPTCTKDGSVVYSCANCSETLTVTIPATGVHNWDEGEVTTPATCASEGVRTYTCEDCYVTKTEVIPKTEDHVWGSWTAAGDSLHSRECSACGAIEYEAHDFGGAEFGTCSVCGYLKEQPVADEGTLIEALVEFWNSRASGVSYYDSNGDLDITLSGLFGYSYYLMGGTYNNIVFSLYNYDYNEVLSSDMQLSVSILDGYQDLYVTLQNDSNPDIKIEYHPIRYTLYVYNESANGGAGDFEVLSDENKTYQDLTIKELNSALTDGVLNRTFAKGSGMDFTFRIEWEWAFMLDAGELFEIKDAEGNTYSFNQGNIDKLDTDLENVINVGYPEHGTISDIDNNTWTVLNRSDAGGNLLYNDEFGFDINVSLNSI